MPGGYIYVTRGILAYLDDESELAGVLGHEIGHVTARHAAQAYTRQAQAGIGLTILSIFVPGTQPFTELGSAGLSVLFLKHGRDAELEADRLGVEYGSGAGWDPSGVPRFLSTLARVDALSEDGVPNWLSTHPDPGSRVGQAEPVAGKFASATATRKNRDEYLDRIDGLVHGDNPKDGIVRGNVFLHPLLRLGLTFPEGWDVINSPEAVMAREPGTEHYMVLQEVEQPRLRAELRRLGGRSVGDVAVAAMRSSGYTVVEGRIEQINGHDAHVGLYRGTAKGTGKVLMRAAHISVGRQMYVVAGFAPEAEFALVDRDVLPAIQSFRTLTCRRGVPRAAQPGRLLRGAAGRLVAIDRRAPGQEHRQRGDAGDHERPRGQRAAPGRRPDQDHRRRGLTLYNRCVARRTKSIAKRIFRFLIALAAIGFAYVAYVYLTLAGRPPAGHHQSHDHGVHGTANPRSRATPAGSSRFATGGCRTARFPRTCAAP